MEAGVLRVARLSGKGLGWLHRVGVLTGQLVDVVEGVVTDLRGCACRRVEEVLGTVGWVLLPTHLRTPFRTR